MVDLKLYAGRWITLTETNKVASVGVTQEEARNIGRTRQPKEHLRLVWISPYPPFIPLPAWPLAQLNPILATEDVWLAGGPVRDLLLGRPLHDWDFAVAGNALSLARKAADFLGGAYYPLDSERGTGRVVSKHPGTHATIILDFAELRGTSIEQDLQLRDFTINAMAITLDGKLIDPTGGQRDLEQRLIRMTNERCFKNDPARLLRAVRQAGALGFQLEANTELALRAQAKDITRISPERIRAEYLNILKMDLAAPSLRALKDLGLLQHTLPEVDKLSNVRQSTPHYFRDTLQHTLSTISALEGIFAIIGGKARHHNVDNSVPIGDWPWQVLSQKLTQLQGPLLAYLEQEENADMPRRDLLKWAALFHDTGKAATRTVDEQGRTHFYGHPEISVQNIQTRLTALHFPKKALGFVSIVVAHHMRLISLKPATLTRRAIYRFYRDTQEAGIGVILLSLADALAVWGKNLTPERWDTLVGVAQRLLTNYFEQQESVVTPRALLNGHDLIRLGVPQGRQIGQFIEAIREAQAAGEIRTREEAQAYIIKSIEKEGTTKP